MDSPSKSNSTIQKNGNISSTNAWKAEEAIAGNSEALQALRELISYPILYARESKIVGLKVQF